MAESKWAGVAMIYPKAWGSLEVGTEPWEDGRFLRVTFKRNNKIIDYIVTYIHQGRDYYNPRGSNPTEKMKEKHREKVIQTVIERQKHSDAIILLGDLNETYKKSDRQRKGTQSSSSGTGRSHTTLHAAGFKDCWAESTKKGGWSFLSKTKSGDTTKSRIDYVYIWDKIRLELKSPRMRDFRKLIRTSHKAIELQWLGSVQGCPPLAPPQASDSFLPTMNLSEEKKKALAKEILKEWEKKQRHWRANLGDHSEKADDILDDFLTTTFQAAKRVLCSEKKSRPPNALKNCFDVQKELKKNFQMRQSQK